MRMPLALIGALCFGAHASGQSVIGFDNVGGPPETKVYVDEWLSATALAPGGSQFLVALYFARVEDGESALMQVGPASGFIGTAQDRYGMFFGGGRRVATSMPGSPGFFQVKAWEAVFGSSYEEASANSAARVGQSPIFLADTSDPNIPEAVMGLIANSSRDRPFRGFVIAVPEPSISLSILAGIAALALVRRRHG